MKPSTAIFLRFMRNDRRLRWLARRRVLAGTVEAGVDAAAREQFLAGADFRHAAVLEDDDLVEVMHGRQPVA